MCQITLSRHLHCTTWIRRKYLHISKDKQIAPLSPMTWEKKKSRAVKPISQMCFYCLFPSSSFFSPLHNFLHVYVVQSAYKFCFFLFQCQCVSVRDIYLQRQASWIKRSGQDGYTHLIPLYLFLLLLVHLLFKYFLRHSHGIFFN